MKSFSKTDVGRLRNSNQDYVFASVDKVGALPNLFIVADGMGGHNAGDTASRMCVEEFVKSLEKTDESTPITIIEKSLFIANDAVHKAAGKVKEYSGMGTTFVGATVYDDVAYVSNVGDSRLYLINDRLKQITVDHSLVEEMVQSGKLHKEDMRTHPNKNIITRALGTNHVVNADYFEIDVKPGDVLLLCSDGLSNMVDDSEIERIVKENKSDLKELGNILVEEANKAGGKDNISVVLVEI